MGGVETAVGRTILNFPGVLGEPSAQSRAHIPGDGSPMLEIGSIL